MKNFWNGIAVWFLMQLILLSAMGNMNNASRFVNNDTLTPEECKHNVSGAVGFISGLLVPLTFLDILNSDWCWNIYSE